MEKFKIGDIVARKSYNSDIDFVISDVVSGRSGKPVYVLKGLLYRIEADCSYDDLMQRDENEVRTRISNHIYGARKYALKRSYRYPRFPFTRLRMSYGKILHVDSSKELMDICIKHYDEANLKTVTHLASESSQPRQIRQLLETHRPDILVVTGHDGIRKDTGDMYSLESYRNSTYFVESVKEARKYQSSYDKLCIFAGACQSYYEAIMDAGANFASSPGRILINGLDPAFVSEKVAVTDSRMFVTPREIASITISGKKGIGGVNTRGHSKAG